MSLTLARVRRRFPEAQEFAGSHGPEIYVHCPRKHRKGPYNFKLSINAESGAFTCHDCGWSGSAYDEWFDGVDEFFAHLSVQPTVPLPATASRRPTQVLDEWMDGVPGPGRVRLLTELPSDHVAWNYLRDDRGFCEEELRAFEPADALFYCEEGAFTRGGGTNGGRIVFPIYMYGELKGWQARQIERKAFDGDGAPSHKLVWNGKDWVRYDWNTRAGKFQDEVKGIPKYNTCPGMQRSQCLYGFDSARRFHSVVEVEGPLDALAVGPEAVATMGGNGSLSLGQAKLICACWDSVVRVLDPKVDTASRGFVRAMESLRAIATTWLKLPDGRDAGATSRDVIWQSITERLQNLTRTP